MGKLVLVLGLSLLCALTPSVLHAQEPLDFDWFWVFYESEILSRGQESPDDVDVFRPFYMRSENGDRIFEASLMPVLFWRYRTPVRDEWFWLFGFGNSVEYRHEDSSDDFDFGFLPFLFFGTGTAENDRYLLLWPFGGTMRGKFGLDRVTAAVFPGFLLFVLFPPAQIFSLTTTLYIVASLIPLYVDYEYRDYHAWGILWPLIHRGRSPGRDELRVLPFYSRFRKEGWYDRYSVLIVFNYEELYFTDDVHRTVFLFPLFGRRWSDSGMVSSTAVLWPLFSWGYNRKTGDTSFNLPWPLVQVQDCETPHIRKRIFFPVFGDYRYERNRTVFVTPLFFRMTKESQRFDAADYYVFIIAWYFSRDYHGQADEYYGTRWRYFKVWPLFNVEYNDLGDFAFNLLSLLPFRDREGYERLYQPLWSLLEYRSFRNGEHRLGLFLRLYFQRWGADFFEMQVPFVVTFETSRDRVREFTMVLSMFGYRHNARGRYLKVFWIPFRIGDPDQDIAEADEAGRRDLMASSAVDPSHPPLLWGDNSVRIGYGWF